MKSSLGQKIRKIREIKGFSQQYVARKLRISQEYYSYLENKIKEVPELYLRKIAALFEVTVDFIKTFDLGDIMTAPAGLYDKPGVKAESDAVVAQKRIIIAYLETISFLKEKISYLEKQVEACREALVELENSEL
ncbi:MAG TPA: helix-turn-helix transcriptional regulator [Chitinophagaceae bacterium]|jgi:transcriptional regulator with XRE-family HTH domain